MTQGESLLEIETDKLVAEIEAPASGILAGVTAAAGDDVPVGQTIALVLAPYETASEVLAEDVWPCLRRKALTTTRRLSSGRKVSTPARWRHAWQWSTTWICARYGRPAAASKRRMCWPISKRTRFSAWVWAATHTGFSQALNAGRDPGHAPAMRAVGGAHQLADQRGQVLATRAERRQVHPRRGQQVIEIVAEPPGGHLGGEVAIARGDQSHVHRHAPGPGPAPG